MPTTPLPSFENIAENALLLTWSNIICATQHKAIIACQQAINTHCQAYVIDSIASYNSLLIYYRFNMIASDELTHQVKQLCIAKLAEVSTIEHSKSANQHIEIPVCYHPSVASDLTTVSKQTGLSIEDVIHLHSKQTYRAYALGFTPGFCYLATLPKQLQLPRKETPALKVPQGSVAIAGQQTAVYPVQSPGGWHIIGQTPMAMYHTTAHNFTPTINVGDSVIFKAISLTAYQQQCQQLNQPLANAQPTGKQKH